MVQHALYDWLMADGRMPLLRNAAIQHYVAEVTRSIYHCALSVVALEAHNQDDIGETEASVKTLCAQTMLRTLGPRWESFQNAQWLANNGANHLVHIQNMVWGIHAHSGCAIMSAGLYARAKAAKPEQRQAIVDALYTTGFKNSIIDVLATAGVRTQDQLDAFMSESLWAAADPLQALHAQGRMGARA